MKTTAKKQNTESRITLENFMKTGKKWPTSQNNNVEKSVLEYMNRVDVNINRELHPRTTMTTTPTLY